MAVGFVCQDLLSIVSLLHDDADADDDNAPSWFSLPLL